ncbi:nitronate monooxygenase [Kitasatospora sp. NPDC004669]|uniref:NAD(P)H-dependent flavin oxidoreductase n=1 Tax=Kitasatospora sp. NPDC004669 TaxID=3154555 RepID=UPI0033B6355E
MGGTGAAADVAGAAEADDGADPALPASFGHDFERQVDALLEARPPVFSFVMGISPGNVLAEARQRGIVTLGAATTVDEAVALDEAGVDAVQIGTGFLVTDESGASPAHKQALRGPQARVTMLTSAFSGRQARTIANRFVRDLARYEGDLPPYPLQGALTEPIRRAAVERGLPDCLNLWVGQAAPLTRPRTAQGYLAALVEETRPRV